MKVRAGPDGIHLFDRLTGWNVLIDESRVPSAMWSSAPRQVSIALTNACDLRCPYCYAPKHAAALDTGRVMRWLQELDEHGCHGVGFGGGEPTLHQRLPELCRWASEHTDLAVTFTTHAHHFTSRLAADLRGNVHFIRVSMDGVGATYESLRGRRFADFTLRLSIVREVAPIGINFVVNAHTVRDLDAAVEIAREVRASEFLLLPQQPTAGAPGMDASTGELLAAWVRTYRGVIPLSVSEGGATGLPTCAPLPLETGLRAYAHIDASGLLKRSSFDGAGVPIGPEGFVSALRALEEIGGTR